MDASDDTVSRRGLARLALPLLGVLVGGTAATAAVALAVSTSPVNPVVLAALGGGVALVAGAAGAGIVWALRERPLGVQVLVVALTAIGAAAAGSWVAARAMYVNRQDLAALAVILVAAGTGAAAVAVLIADRFRRQSRLLVARARRLGADPDGGDGLPAPDIRELRAVATAMDDAAERLARARERERDMEASRRQLVADVSHDLRTPMAKVRALTEALEDGVVTDPAEVARYHGLLRGEADRLTRLVDDLFELSRAQARRSLETETVALDDVVSDGLASARALARSRDVELAGAGGTAARVRVSVRDLSRVLDNLLSNAIRHSGDGGTVEVATATRDGRAEVAVQDTCGGIDPDVLPHVFDVAYSADRTGAGGGGTGLGLAIARGLIELYDGEVTAENRGPGCRFTVRLPAVQAGS